MGHARPVAALLAVAFALASAPAPVRADEPAGAIPLDVQVGQTVVVDVAYARGIHCDDVSILTPEIRPHDPQSNWFYVTGRSPGTTLCRVGVFVHEVPSYLFRVRVHP